MSRAIRRALPLLVVVLAAAAPAFAQTTVPALVGRVNDYAKLFNDTQIRALEQKLAAFENETTNQIVVLTTPSLGGEDIAGYSIRVAEAWKIGQQGRDNGVIIVIAPNERKMRIEVGYGLEGALPDAIASRINNEVLAPEFREQRYYEGVDQGVDVIIAATKGEYKAPVLNLRHGRRSSAGGLAGTVFMIFIFILLISTRTGRFLLFASMLGGRRGGGWSSGGGFSGGGGRFGGGGSSGSW